MKKIISIFLVLTFVFIGVNQVIAGDDDPPVANGNEGVAVDRNAPVDPPPADPSANTATGNTATPPAATSNAPSFYDTTNSPVDFDRDKYSVGGIQGKVLPKIATWIASFLAGIAVLFLIYAGILFLTAAGDPDQIGKATKTAVYVLGGVLLAMFAFAVIYLFISIFAPT